MNQASRHQTGTESATTFTPCSARPHNAVRDPLSGARVAESSTTAPVGVRRSTFVSWIGGQPTLRVLSLYVRIAHAVSTTPSPKYVPDAYATRAIGPGHTTSIESTGAGPGGAVAGQNQPPAGIVGRSGTVHCTAARSESSRSRAREQRSAADFGATTHATESRAVLIARAIVLSRDVPCAPPTSGTQSSAIASRMNVRRNYGGVTGGSVGVVPNDSLIASMPVLMSSSCASSSVGSAPALIASMIDCTFVFT